MPSRTAGVLAALLFVAACGTVSDTVSAPSEPQVPERQALVAAGYGFSCALVPSGAVECWGTAGNVGGAASGNPDDTTPTAPVAVELPTSEPISALAAGPFHVCALAGDGSAWCWGSGRYGQLGDGTDRSHALPERVVVPTDVRFVEISAGTAHTCALDEDGRAWCWGDGTRGQLGTGDSEPRMEPTPVAMPDGASLRAISAGNSHTCAVTTEGAAWCWGFNVSGELGDGGTENSSAPKAVAAPEGVVFTDIGAGYAHTCAVTSEGAAWCWGSPEALASDAATATPTPVDMPPGVAFSSVSAGESHTCAVTTDGAAWCWGANWSSQIGDGTDRGTARPSTVALPSGTRVVQLASGSAHSCAVTTEGAVWCWGSNDFGELGVEVSAPKATPIAVPL